ncbi:MAG: flagellar basal body L-ring protein FlgH [Phycisphaeraceae bacterium]|nr:flagellar basal body L-ring protein FlgH [Phycisphaeraceae bacterium]
MNALRIVAVVAAVAGVGMPACGQSFFTREGDVLRDSQGQSDPHAALRAVSLSFVQPPMPREFAIHDLVTIIIDETSRSESQQKLETEKDYEIKAALKQFPSLRHLIEGQFENGDTQRSMRLDLSGGHEFNSEGNARRSDRFIARITAEVIDVKPNGTLALEARKQIVKDREVQTIVLSGTCRREDVTTNNTITSSQLAALTVIQSTDGDISRAAKKGLIPRVFESIFNF